MPVVKLHTEFLWDDRVRIISGVNTSDEGEPDDRPIGIIIELLCSSEEIKYKVVSGFEEKDCYATELELISRPEKKNKDDKKDKGI